MERQKELFSTTMRKFRKFDRNKDGTIDHYELRSLLQFLDDRCWSDEKVDELFEAADINDDNRIQFEEFVRWCFDGTGEHQSDFREDVGLSDFVQPMVMLTLKSVDGSIVFGPEEMDGDFSVGMLRRQVRRDTGQIIGCLLSGQCILRDSMALGVYAPQKELSLTCIDDVFSVLSDSCRSSLKQLGALQDFMGAQCLRLGWKEDLAHAEEGEVVRGDEDGEIMLRADGRFMAKYYAYKGVANGSTSSREWKYEIGAGTFSVIDKETCVVEVYWQNWGIRQARDENADGPPNAELLQSWEGKEVTDCDFPHHLFPTPAGHVNMIQAAKEYLNSEPMMLSQEPEENPLGGIPMPGVTRAALIEMEFDTEVQEYWSHGEKQGGPQSFSGRTWRSGSKQTLAQIE